MDTSNRGHRFRDLTDQRFGKLTALTLHSMSRSGHARWLCRCDCGRDKDILGTHLVQGQTISCGCHTPHFKERGPQGTGADHPSWRGYGEISGQFWGQIKRSAAGAKSGRRPLSLTLTIEEAWDLFLAQSRECALSGLPLRLGSRYTEPGNASLDRIDSALGYDPGNVQWVHKDINWMKGSLAQAHFIALCNAVAASAAGGCEL